MTKVYDDVMNRSSAPTEGRFYVGRASLPLYAEPNFASKQVTELPLNEPVERRQINHGFAHVRVLSTGQEGWVDNAKLNWREAEPKETAATVSEPPARTPPSEPIAAPSPGQPVAAQSTSPDRSAPAAPPDASDAAAKDRKNVDPALFDAF